MTKSFLFFVITYQNLRERESAVADFPDFHFKINQEDRFHGNDITGVGLITLISEELPTKKACHSRAPSGTQY
ncbi:hypothetical protein D4R71_08605 [bacterium]|nr:MAG: hypothetical protein D4R71_08605 [bacterium]